MPQQSSAVHHRDTVLIVEPVSSGVRLVRDAAALGYRVVVTSADRDDRSLSADLRELVDTLLLVDTNDEQALTDRISEFHAETPLTAVLPGAEFYIPAVTRLNRELGLPGLPVEAAETVRNKALMREAVAGAGLRVPRFAVARTADEVAAAGALVGYPCVLKPVASSGSIHVSRADSAAELAAAYGQVCADQRLDLGFALDAEVVVEEYVDGPEYSADGYVEDGRTVIVSLTRKLLGPEPYFVELGHIVPSEEPDEVTARVQDYVAGVTRAVGISSGAFHCELRLPEGDPVLIEIAARLGGDRIADLVETATGVSLSRVMLAAYTGRTAAEVDAFGAARAKCAGIRYFTAERLAGAGRPGYAELQGWEALAERPEVIETVVVIPPGEEIPELQDFRGRVGYALFTADSAAQALETWHALGDAVTPV